MNSVNLAILLKEILSKGTTLVLHTSPSILDFTNSFEEKHLLVITKDETTFQIPLDKKLLSLGILNSALFQNKDLTLICWNIKNYFSYLKSMSGNVPDITANILDLKATEGFLGISNAEPTSFADAVERVKVLLKEENWPQCKMIYKRIHLPLIVKVLPALETVGIADLATRKMLYSYYEIEGQANGRLECQEPYIRSFNPHSLGPDARENFLPIKHDYTFLLCDYKNYEVSVLQALSGDERLKQILDLDEDFYKVVFKLIFNADCDTDKKRGICKELFLPTYFGMSAKTISEKFGFSQNSSEKILNKINSLFPTSFSWIKQYLNNTTDYYYDFFGRKRWFSDRKHRVMGFKVQAPAALLSLDKLVKLYESLSDEAKIACHIHDGYLLYVKKSTLKTTSLAVKRLLEESSDLIPGIKLRVVMETGNKLSEMKEMV